jgi:predicted outer membrane repeat protein
MKRRHSPKKAAHLLEPMEPRRLLSTTFYVDYSAQSSTPNGTSWPSAFTNLQDALLAASSGDEIHVADGAYVPTSGTDRNATFQLKTGVAIYGGYEGISGIDPDHRDIAAFPSILSGNIGSASSATDNSYHVVTGSGTDPTAVLDGFTIRDGYANGSSNARLGAGMFSSGGSPSISHCTFTANTAASGAGIYNTASSATAVSDCLFLSNTGTSSAAAVWNGSSSGSFTRCRFVRNSAQLAGAIVNSGSSPSFSACVFQGNAALNSYGGAIYNTSSSSPAVTNCEFSANSAKNGGGAIWEDSTCAPLITNCTFAFNRAGSYGGGLGDSYKSTVTNCIFWGNTDVNGQPQISAGGYATTSYNDIQGGFSGSGAGNIDVDPLFVRNPNPGLDGTWGTADDDYGDLRPQACSLTIDAGNNSAVPGGTTTDLAGNNRFVDVSGIPDAGAGTAPIVDMGAYEAVPALALTAGGPYVVLSGQSIALSARAVSDVDGPLSYAWEWTGDGLFDDASGPSPQFNSTGVAPGVVSVSLRVTDSASHSLIVAASLRVLPSIVYVDSRATGASDGTTWSNAFPSLATAMDLSVPGVTIRVAKGTYKPTTGTNRAATFQLKSGVTVYGGYAGVGASDPSTRNVVAFPTVLSGDIGANGTTSDNSYHVVTASGADQTASVDGLTIRDGYGSGAGAYMELASPRFSNCIFTANFASDGGAVYCKSSSPDFTNCTFTGNAANILYSGNHYGGAVYNYLSSPTFTDCSFINNYNDGQGGAIYNWSSPANMTRCVFTGNRSGTGGAITLSSTTPSSITGCIFISNYALVWGGALSVNGPLVLTDCRFDQNIADSGGASWGGGAIANYSGDLSVTNCSFTANTSRAEGGAIDHRSRGALSFVNCSFNRNSAGLDGGAVYTLSGTTMSIANCSFTENSAGGTGGAVMTYFAPQTATITSCTFTRNTATSGGAVYNTANNLTLDACSFLGNAATGSGGGLYSSYPATVTNSVFVGNQAASGGGLYEDAWSFLVIGCTFSSNVATAGGGLYFNQTGYQLTNSILWGNNAPTGAQCYTPIGGVSYTFSDVQNSTFGGPGVIKLDPKFIRSPSPGTDGIWGTSDDDYGDVRLSATSPCIDAGSNAAIPSGIETDRAGNPRKLDVPGIHDPGAIVDMGAYERTPPVAISSAAWLVNLPKPTLQIVFDGDIDPASITGGDLSLLNLTTSQLIDCTTAATFTFNGPRTAIWTFNGVLPDGNYRATLPPGSISDVGGNPLAGALTVDFFALGGDANRDRKVDINDLAILSMNWRGTGKVFSQGDFNYDGTVDAADLGILSAHWQAYLPPPAAPATPIAATRAPTRTPIRASVLT